MLKELTKTISPVLVINNSSLKPYVELFEYSPENIYQQPLGSLVGFFEIKEYSEDSAYIVNFLTSVLKKEYYVNPKRPVNESLDSALHKVNMALSELAKQGNVEWLGNLHAAICVLEKNNAHFGVAGNAKLFLYRKQILSDISDGLASDSPEPHPLKTFVNVSSGRLEKGDRLLITSEDIFHILSIVDLRKNFQRLEGDKFVQFLKTALSNQMEMIATMVVEMTEIKNVKETKMPASRKKSAAAINVFSEKAFTKAQSSTDSLKKEQGDDDIADQEDDFEYTDEKTGHIYVQGEAVDESESVQANIYWDMTKEKIAQAWYASKNDIRRRFSLYKKQLAKKRELMRIEKEKRKQLEAEEKKHEQEQKVIDDMRRDQLLASKKEHEIKIREAYELAHQREEQQLIRKREAEYERQRQIKQAEEFERRQRESEASDNQQQLKEKIVAIEETETQQDGDHELSFLEKLALAKNQNLTADSDDLKNDEIEKESDTRETVSSEDTGEFPLTKQEIEALKNFAQKTSLILKSTLSGMQKLSEKARLLFGSDTTKKIEAAITPHFSKIRKSYSSFTSKQKMYTFLALVLIFIVPLFIARWMNRPKTPTITELVATPPTQTEILSDEKNMHLAPQVQTALDSNDILDTLITNDGTAAITKTGITMLNSGTQKEYPLPADAGTAIRGTFMQDLSLVLIMTDQGKIVSFSPVSLKYVANNIILPTNYSADFIGTYLTYLYVLDPSANQIYRYPRATGGFGDKTNWLKDATSLSQVSDMTIDDNIYVIQNNQVIKLFKGKAQQFTLEASRTPVHFDKIFTTVDSSSLYVLDTENSRIVQYGKADDTIIAQYFSEKLSAGTSLSIDEPNKTAYVSTSSELISISLQ